VLSALTIWWYGSPTGKMVGLNTILTGVAVILWVFFLWNDRHSLRANPPLNENNPSNVFSLLSYLNRDQYVTDHFLKDNIQCSPG
jgi:hypothetical protein